MLLDVALHPSALGEKRNYAETLVVAVDVLRATTTMIVLINQQCKWITPCASVQEAIDFARQHQAILVGEENTNKPEAFDYDNSPSELLANMGVYDKPVALSTTNGTKLFQHLKQKSAKHVVIGSFINMRALVQYIDRQPLEKLVIACAGHEDQPCMEDTGFGGALIAQLLLENPNHRMTDAAQIALSVWHQAQEQVGNILTKSAHAKTLLDKNRLSDIKFVATATLAVVPIYMPSSNRVMTLSTASAASG